MLSLVIEHASGSREISLALKQMVLGRAGDSDIIVSDVGVSRKHCVIRREGARWFIEDLGSARGTFVNDARVQRQRLELKKGDVLRIGESPLKVRVVERLLEPAEVRAWEVLQAATDEQRLVRADELEQNGQLEFADWVRAELELRQHAVATKEYRHAQGELAALAEKVPPHLRALLARVTIEGCAFPPCPREWSKLALTRQPLLRGCATCNKNVTYCDTTEEGRQLFPAPIVVDPCRERRPGDTRPMPRMMPVG
ncbi:MAG: FHA domain-containing protein [Archangium sp.]|nr:FHA domain-containing protein [Archangium sp.]